MASGQYTELIISFSYVQIFDHKFFAITFFHCTSAIYVDLLRSFRFTEVKRVEVEEVKGVPPTFKIVFDLACNEKFLKVVRHDETDPKSGKVIIAARALVAKTRLESALAKLKKWKFLQESPFPVAD